MDTHLNGTLCSEVLLLYIHLDNLLLTKNLKCPYVGGWRLNLDMQNITITAILLKKEGCTAAKLPLFKSLKSCHGYNLQNDSLLF